MTPLEQLRQRLRERIASPGRRRRLAETSRPPARVTDDDLRAAEARLGVPLPPSYCALVTSFDWDDLPDVYWLGKDLPPGVDLLGINASAPVPSFLVAVMGDGGGDEFCLDTRHPDPATGEYPIVRWDHEVDDEQSTEFARVAPDLAEFLLTAV
jgi:hypothetical protein